MANLTVGMIIDFYIGDMKLKNRSPESIQTNRNTLKRFALHAGSLEMKLAHITAETAKSYIETLQSQGSKWAGHPNHPLENKPLSPYTIRKIVKVLRGFGTWMTAQDYGNPFSGLPIPKVPDKEIETLSDEEIQRIFSVINPNTQNGARNFAIVMFMLDTGVRISEVAGLKMENLDFKSGSTKLMGKGSKERTVCFGQKCARALLRYTTAFRPRPVNSEAQSVFLSLDGFPLTRNALECIVQRLRTASGVSKLHAHLLRHTFAVRFLMAGGDLETLRRLLGHASLEVTQIYLRALKAKQVQQLYINRSPMDKLEVKGGMRRFSRRGFNRGESDD